MDGNINRAVYAFKHFLKSRQYLSDVNSLKVCIKNRICQKHLHIWILLITA